MSFFALLPLFWMVLTSIRPLEEVFSIPPTPFIKNITWENYLYIFSDNRFQRYFLNSTVVSLSSALISTLIATLAGYGFSRFKFKNKERLFLSVIFCQMIPLTVIIMPLYYIMEQYKLLDTYFSLILSYFIITLPFSTWMSRAAFTNVPIELEEAAQIDGCDKFRSILLISMRIAAPAIAAIFAFCFIEAWNEYVLAMTFINSTSMRTIQIGIMLFRGEFYTDWGKLMAASTIESIPIIILFIFIQKYFVSGLARGAIKR
jgi:ABC-type glycerol-3-phosphate transport system permease component